MTYGAGKLKDRVTILVNQALTDPENHRDQYGQLEESWVPLLSDIAADVLFKNGSRFIAQDRDQSKGIASVRIRYRPTVKSAMRVQIGDDVYKMTAPPLPTRCRQFLDLAIDTLDPDVEG